MIGSRNSHFREYLKFLFLLKFITYLHLFWNHNLYSDVYNNDKSSDNKDNFDVVSGIIFYRSLVGNEYNNDYDYPNMNDKILDHEDTNGVEGGAYYLSPYEQLSKRALNDGGVIQRNYKNRFGKKRGIARLEQYFEKKVFDKIDDIYELSKKMKHDKKSYKKKILSKYGYNLISFCLLPLLGLIYFILFGSDDLGKGIIKFCNHTEHTRTPSCTEYMYNDYKDILQCVGDINLAYSSIMVIIVVCFIMYILIKVIKYEKIKAVKGKMSMKEYFRFGKGVFKIN